MVAKGLVRRHALAAGVPVVARGLPVLREVLGAHVTYAATPRGIAAALVRVLDAPPDPAGGRAHAHGFSWERCAVEHLTFYRSSRVWVPARARR